GPRGVRSMRFQRFLRPRDSRRMPCRAASLMPPFFLWENEKIGAVLPPSAVDRYSLTAARPHKAACPHGAACPGQALLGIGTVNKILAGAAVRNIHGRSADCSGGGT